MAMKKLTETQSIMLDFIQEEVQLNGMPPTRKEIAKYFGFKSANGAHEHLLALQRKGWIRILPRTARGIQILPTGSSKSE